MTLRDQLLQAVLWYSVFAWGSWFGGTLYQMLVVVPMWNSSPPDSVRTFFLGTEYNRTIVRFFGPPFMAARTIPVVFGLALAWNLPDHRRALALAVTCIGFAVIYTVWYIYPINAVLFEQAGGDRSSVEISAMARRWVLADRIRFAVGSIGLASILWAFQLPLPRP